MDEDPDMHSKYVSIRIPECEINAEADPCESGSETLDATHAENRRDLDIHKMERTNATARVQYIVLHFLGLH
jgi:hypothetical protein